MIYLLTHNLCFYFTSLPLSSKPPSPIPPLYSYQCVHLTKQVIRELTLPPQNTSFYSQIYNWPAQVPTPSTFLPIAMDELPSPLVPTPLSLLVTWGFSVPSDYHMTLAISGFHILSFGSFAWAHSFIEAKITRKKPFFNPIFLSSYHPFLCSSLQQNSCKTCLHTWSPLPFLPISLEAIGDFVPTNLHWNPLDTVRWNLPTTTPLPIQWPILSTCLTSL